ncbi:MAG: hypothetical protein MMC33_002982 [Icmadophila ericetorum]|nr:hypothetical protein [Icmadophila ericetorum]
MSVEVDLIFGDNEERTVFAQAHDSTTQLIFNFGLDLVAPQSLPSHIVICFHEIAVSNRLHSFADHDDMRKAVRDSIQQQWNRCLQANDIKMPDLVIEISGDGDGRAQFLVCHESSYEQYIKSLQSLNALFENQRTKHQTCSLTEYSELTFSDSLGDRGNSALARMLSNSSEYLVFKGADFARFLESPKLFNTWTNILYREIQTLQSLEVHPNVQSPATQFVIARTAGKAQDALICGTLYTYLSWGDLNQYIEAMNGAKKRTSLPQRLLWCSQMTCALGHTHLSSQSFHMDVKPSNFFLGYNNIDQVYLDLVLIDWEQNGAPTYTLSHQKQMGPGMWNWSNQQ